ncbi:MAG: M50 family metallopeptidase [Clostridia bacterium]|nr:M50 family metallopeptidase [Clostridia bacterium]
MKKTKKILKRLLFYVIALLVGGLIGIILFTRFDANFGGALFYVEIALAMFLSLYASIIIHEGGHLVFGLISGYSFSSFRIGSIMLLRQNGKYRLCNFKLVGTGGQCLMAPPDKNNEDIPVVLYNLGGVIFNLIFTVIFAVLFMLVSYVYILSLTLLISSILCFTFALSNGIPMHIGGIANDGMNAKCLSKDKMATTAFLNQLRMNEAQIRGLSLNDMPDEWFVIPEGADKKNVAYATIAVLNVNRSLEKKDTEKSTYEIEKLLESDWQILGVHRNLLLCDLIYCRLMNDGEGADVTSLLTPELKKFMKAMKNFAGVVRSEYALDLIYRKDEATAEKRLKMFEKRYKNTPTQKDAQIERELMAKAKEKYDNLKNQSKTEAEI